MFPVGGHDGIARADYNSAGSISDKEFNLCITIINCNLHT